MQSFFSMVMSWVQWLVGIVPASARPPAKIWRIVHYSVVVVVALLLLVFSDRINGWLLAHDFGELKHEDWPGWVQHTSWGCLFILSYVLIRLLVYLVMLLRVPEEVEFADIWNAWIEALEGLEDQRLDMRWLPVFLVNGLSREEEQRFFQSVRMNWKVTAPDASRRTSPLRLFANEEAVFISCTSVGAVSAQLTNYEGAPAPKGPVLGQIATERDAAFSGTMAPGRMAEQRVLAQEAASSGGTLRHAAPSESSAAAGEPNTGLGLGGTLRRTLARTFSFGGTLAPGIGAPKLEKPDPAAVLVPLPQNKLHVARRRMAFLCNLLGRERSPWCALNGMLQAAPLSWSDPSKVSAGPGELCRSVATDVEAVRKTLEIEFPITFLMTGFECVEGFKEFVERCMRKEPRFRDSRAGSRYPIGRPVEEESSNWVVGRVLHWLKGWIYNVFADDLDNPANRKIYYLLCTLRKRQRLLEAEVERSFGNRPGSVGEPPVPLSGVYLGATGEGLARQAFGRDVLQKLIQEQDSVAWSARRLHRDRLARTSAYVLFGVAVILAILNVWLFVRARS